MVAAAPREPLARGREPRRRLAFAALAAYRLVQLRPDLVSIAREPARAIACCSRTSGRRPGGASRAAAALAALWANVHAGFPLGSLLIGAALARAACSPRRCGRPSSGARDRARARRLAAALALAALATLANPAGLARATSPTSRRAPARPRSSASSTSGRRPPVRAARAAAAALAARLGARVGALLGVALVLVARARAASAARRPRSRADRASSLLALALLLSAVRFLWLGIFPLLLLARAIARADAPRVATARAPRAAWIARRGVRCSRRLRQARRLARDHARPARRPARLCDARIRVDKYYAHAIWLLADSGVRGNLYNDYFLGGFAGYWLAPDVRTIVNGTLTFRRETLDALGAIAQRRGLRPGEDFPALLDRLGIDLFLGSGCPRRGRPARRWIATTAHLEDTPGWIPIFRNLESALYLRANERNRENLDRARALLRARSACRSIRERGFEVDAVIRDAPDWAIAPRRRAARLRAHGAQRRAEPREAAARARPRRRALRGARPLRARVAIDREPAARRAAGACARGAGSSGRCCGSGARRGGGGRGGARRAAGEPTALARIARRGAREPRARSRSSARRDRAAAFPDARASATRLAARARAVPSRAPRNR